MNEIPVLASRYWQVSSWEPSSSGTLVDRAPRVAVQPGWALVPGQLSGANRNAVIGFWLAARGDWRRMAACTAGFVLARYGVVRLTRLKKVLSGSHFRSADSLAARIIKLNATIATTWAMMIAMAAGSKLVTRKLVTEGAIRRWQGLLEILVTSIDQQIETLG